MGGSTLLRRQTESGMDKWKEPTLIIRGSFLEEVNFFLAYELNQNRTTQTGSLIHRMKSVGLKGWPTAWDWRPVSPGQEDVQQELGLLIVGAHAPIESSGNPAGAATPQQLPRASQPKLGPDVYLFPPGFPFVCSVDVSGRP